LREKSGLLAVRDSEVVAALRAKGRRRAAPAHVVEPRHRRDPLGAMHERTRYRNHHPAVEMASVAVNDAAQYGIFDCRFGGGMFLSSAQEIFRPYFEKFEHLVVLDDARAAACAQTDMVAREISVEADSFRYRSSIGFIRLHPTFAFSQMSSGISILTLRFQLVLSVEPR
jgi:hypothetical protein